MMVGLIISCAPSVKKISARSIYEDIKIGDTKSVVIKKMSPIKYTLGKQNETQSTITFHDKDDYTLATYIVVTKDNKVILKTID